MFGLTGSWEVSVLLVVEMEGYSRRTGVHYGYQAISHNST